MSLVTRHFGIRQGAKIRPVDSFLESGLNGTTRWYGLYCGLRGVAAALACRVSTDAKCRSHYLCVRSYNLHKAHKDMPSAASALSDSFLSVFHPDLPGARLFRQMVLPFGSRHSMRAFCRVSLGFWKLAVEVI